MRCAIYTRKSSDEGLRQEFNSLDAQREAAEAYIASQKAEGWVCLPDRYDDGGFTGGNTDRPALKRLLADIAAGGVDTVVVYKIDRFSRSLADFMRMMTVFEEHGVAFVSVTQAFDTGSSMGRLTLNILLSFAQFEREIIGERIRDKIAASRRKGKWTGGTPILGYDVDRSSGSPKLVVNAVEASRVREIFELYIEHGSLLPVVADLERREWRNKPWTTRSGRRRGGVPFDKGNLHKLLTNILYTARVRHREAIYPGEHEAIIPEETFERVQRQLQRNGRVGGPELRNRQGSLLRGLLFCKACNRAMSHTFTCRGRRRYRYYACTHAVKSGRAACPTASLPAAEIEKAVVDQIRCIGRDPNLLAETLREARRQTAEANTRLTGERRGIERDLARFRAEIRRATMGSASGGMAAEAPAGTPAARLAQLADQAVQAERRVTEIDARLAELQRDDVTKADVTDAFTDFDNVWTALTPREQVRLINLLIERVEFDAADDSIQLSFHATGIKTLGSGEGWDESEMPDANHDVRRPAVETVATAGDAA
ncbi:MAG: recombinase family protein [Phycisphaerales bacterium]|nr:recombinase family protein [Phycisphaerales bacterium]